MAVEKIDPDRCSGCLRCVEVCPMDVIRPEGPDPKIKYPEDCQSCYLCVLECPAGAMGVMPWRAISLGNVYGCFEKKVGSTN